MSRKLQEVHPHLQATKDELVARYSQVVEVTARGISRKVPITFPLDDLRQWGFVGLLEAIDLCSADQAESFDSYAALYIRGRILKNVKKQWRNAKAVEFPIPIEFKRDESENPEQKLLRAERDQLNHDRVRDPKVLANLDEQERQVLAGTIAGKKFGEIAIDIGRSDKTVFRLRSRLKRKLSEEPKKAA